MFLTRQVPLAHITKRRQLVEMRKQELTRLQQTTDRDARSEIKSLILLLERRIEKVETKIAEIIRSSAELVETDCWLQSLLPRYGRVAGKRHNRSPGNRGSRRPCADCLG